MSHERADMPHAQFVAAYGTGRIRVHINAQEAARFVSARLLLPFILLPVLGIGVALALTGWLWTGLATIGCAIAARWIIKRSAAHFVLTQSLADEALYRAAVEHRLLQITEQD